MSFIPKVLVVFALTAFFIAPSAAVSESVSGATAETGWEWTNPFPQGNDLLAAVGQNGVRVAVGSNGTIIASTDTVRWKVVNGSTEYALFDVIWANGLFVAVGGQYGFEFSSEFGVVLTSADGFNWVERHTVDYFLARSVIWDGARFVAVGNGSRVLFSSDGIHWTNEVVDLADWEILDVVWDGSRYLAVGNAFFGYGSVFVSEDAVSWQEVPLECECSLEAIAWGNDTYVAVGFASTGWGGVLVSTNAQNWDQLSFEDVGRLNDVIHGAEGFLSVGAGGIVARSADGQTWSFPDTHADGRSFGVTEDENGFLAVGYRGFTMMSQDGLQWDVISSDSLNVYRTIEITEMAVGGDVVVGVGEYGLIIRSEDGAQWLTNPSWGLGFYQSVVRIGSEFWAVADYGIAHSTDGLDWELMLYDTDVLLFDIAWNGEVFVAVGWSGIPEGGSSLVTTSRDGYEWTHQPIDAGGQIQAVRWTGSRFVAVGEFGVHLTSLDGFSWFQHPQDESIDLKDMEWNGDRLVAVGGRQGVGGVIRSSADGISWDEGLPPEFDEGSFRDVAWTGSKFLAVGITVDNRIFRSADGIGWKIDPIGVGFHPSAVCGDERSLHLAGRGGKMLRKVLRREMPPPRRSGRRISPSSSKWLPVSSVIQ